VTLPRDIKEFSNGQGGGEVEMFKARKSQGGALGGEGKEDAGVNRRTTGEVR